MSKAIKAITTDVISKEMTKDANGNKFVLINCEILEGDGKGMIVPGTFGTLTGDKSREVPVAGTKVVLYHQALPSTKEAGKTVHFFGIGLGAMTATNDELTAVFGEAPVALAQNV